MVARAVGYYGETFCGERGVTQGNPLSPTIFNVVVDAVVCHWESLVAERDGGASSMMMETRYRRWGGKSRYKTTSNGGRGRAMQG